MKFEGLKHPDNRQTLRIMKSYSNSTFKINTVSNFTKKKPVMSHEHSVDC